MNGMRRAIVVALLTAGVVAAPGGAARAIENGVLVPSEALWTTGAIHWRTGSSFLCSGMLVTPRWALTAGHCGVWKSWGVIAALGNIGDAGVPTAAVEESFAHPLYNYNNAQYDVRLVRLAKPLYPRYPGGRLWEMYKRDLYRGPVADLDGALVDVYGHGRTHGDDNRPDDKGTMRLGTFAVEGADDERLFWDDDSTKTQKGDSGAAVLVPGYGRVTSTGYYSIASVVSRDSNTVFDREEQGANSEAIAAWFDSLVGQELSAFKAPSLIINVTYAR